MTQKPKMEDAFNSLLDGENLNNARAFTAHLKDNKINTQWTNTNTWKAVKKGVVLCYIKMGADVIAHSLAQRTLKYSDDAIKGSWTIYPHITSIEEQPHITSEDKALAASDWYDEIISNEPLHHMICAKVRKCVGCGNKQKCASGINVTLWGQQLRNCCKFIAAPFVNPDATELACVMRLLDIYFEAKSAKK